jgi:uncharacterized protein (TIGR04141 family)
VRIAYYLFKKSVTSFDEIWRNGETSPGGAYEPLSLMAIPFEAVAYLQAKKAVEPPWWSFVEPYCKVPEGERPRNRSSSLILALKVKERIWAVTFGHGFAALDRARLEPDFGLKVALNTVAPRRLRSVQARNIDPTTVSKLLVVNHDSALSVFDVNFYQDLLSRLEGVPDDDGVGTRVAGADACYVSSDITLPNLGSKCSELLKLYGSRRYRKHFPFIDQVRPARDQARIKTLNAALRDALKEGDVSALSFALPNISSYERIESYRLSRGHWNEAFDDLNAEDILKSYNAGHDDGHLDVKVSALSGDGMPVETFQLSEALVFQVCQKGSVYVLTLGKWYEVRKDYAEQVDAEVAQIDVITETNYLPPIKRGNREDKYTEAASDGKTLALLDKKTVKPAGATSAIEVCDLFSERGEFIHVKRHTRSATLSHLLAQGTVSAQLFIDDRSYRTSFREALPEALQSLIDTQKVEPGRHAVVYAITAPATKEMPRGLPFFTKVNLLFHCRGLQRMGMVPRLVHVHEV